MIHRDSRDGVAVLSIQHGKANALDVELLAALTAALTEAGTARAVVLTGTDKVFSAGVDLFRLLAEQDSYAADLLAELDRCLTALFHFPRPVVAAINGHAIAGGCILVAACDHRIMTSSNAKIGVTELPVGVPFPVVPFEILRAAVPSRHFAELIYGGRTYYSTKALELGLVDDLAAPPLVVPRAVEAAEKFAGIAPATFALTKRQLRAPVVEAMRRNGELFDEEIAAVWKAPETRKAIEAFLEKTVGKRVR